MRSSLSLYPKNEKVLKELFEHYSELMCNYAYHYLNDEKEAEDTVQDVFIRIWERDDLPVDNESLIRTYILKSVRNGCLDKLKKRKLVECRIDTLNFDVLDEKFLTFDEKLMHDIQDEIARMPAQTRNVISGIFFRELKYQEMADELGISINTVKTLLRKGLKHLRDKFDSDVELLLIFFRKKTVI